MSFLSVNLGNSRFSCAVFEKKKVVKKLAFPLSSDPVTEISAFARSNPIEIVGLCSVNPPLEAKLEKALLSLKPRKLLKIGKDLEVGIPNRSRQPERVGLDRLVVARAAWEKWHRKCIALDFGTAVTLNAVSTEGEFIGGAIGAGFQLSLNALHHGTAKLPKVETSATPSILGQDTEEAMNAGVHFGLLGLCEEWIRQAKKTMGDDLLVVATGGDLDRLRGFKSIDYFEPDLIHEGIHLICQS